MSNSEVSITMTLKLDEEWSQHQDEDELVDYLRARIDSSLGFRGRIKRLRLVAKRSETSENS